MKKYNIITEIEGVKYYVRRIRHQNNGLIAVAMLTTAKAKAIAESMGNALINQLSIKVA